MQLVSVVLVAVALGALLPVAFQLAMTMRAARKLIVEVEPRLKAALDGLSLAAASANRSMSALDGPAVQRTLEGVAQMGNLAKSAREFTTSIGMASAVGAAAAPAVAAAIRAWRTPDAPSEPEPAHNPEAHNGRP